MREREVSVVEGPTSVCRVDCKTVSAEHVLLTDLVFKSNIV